MAVGAALDLQGNRTGTVAGFVQGIDCTVAIDTCTRAPADSGPFACDVLPYPTEDVTKYYTFGREIGRGSYGVVRECTSISTGEVLACKVIKKSHLKAVQDRKVVAREIGLMQMVRGHPAIVRVEGVFEDDREVVIVMELCNGGELYHQILSTGRFPEAEAAAVFAQLVDGIRHCHDRGVIHRDLKPENVLFHHRPAPGAESPEQLEVGVKLADFGLGTWLGPGQCATARIGSLMYEAPEVVCGSLYDFKADMWSLGVILHALLSGTLPFIDNDQRKLARKICSGHFELRCNPWPFVSDEAKALIRRLVVVNPNQRPTAEEVLNDPWIRFHLAPDSPKTPPIWEQKRSSSQGSFQSVPCTPEKERLSHPKSPASARSARSPLPASPRGNKKEILSDNEDGYESLSDVGGGVSAVSRQNSYASALSSASQSSAVAFSPKGKPVERQGRKRRGQHRRWRHSQHTCCAPFLDPRWWTAKPADGVPRKPEAQRQAESGDAAALLFQKLQPELSEASPKEASMASPVAAKFSKSHVKGEYYQMAPEEEGGAVWKTQHGRGGPRRFFSVGRRSAVRL